MRLWTLHPQYLDSKGLVALWREALLAQRVLEGATRGYRHHPQLTRFRAQPDPLAAVAAYLEGVHTEACRRGYRFDATKLRANGADPPLIDATTGQLRHEWAHLQAKLRRRDPERAMAQAAVAEPVAHPLFRRVPGPVADWERSAD